MVSNGASTCMKKVPKVHVGGLICWFVLHVAYMYNLSLYVSVF